MAGSVHPAHPRGRGVSGQLREWGLAVEALTREHVQRAPAPDPAAELPGPAHCRGPRQQLAERQPAMPPGGAALRHDGGATRRVVGASPVRRACRRDPGRAGGEQIVPLIVLLPVLLHSEQAASQQPGPRPPCSAPWRSWPPGPTATTRSPAGQPAILAVAGARDAARLALLALAASPSVSWNAVTAAGQARHRWRAALHDDHRRPGGRRRARFPPRSGLDARSPPTCCSVACLAPGRPRRSALGRPQDALFAAGASGRGQAPCSPRAPSLLLARRRLRPAAAARRARAGRGRGVVALADCRLPAQMARSDAWRSPPQRASCELGDPASRGDRPGRLGGTGSVAGSVVYGGRDWPA